MPPFAWARLNADTVFLALLAFGSGAFSLANPHDSATVQALHNATATYYLWAASYMAAGVLIFAGLVKAKIRVEVFGRAVLLGGVAVNVWRTGLILGWGSTACVGGCILFGIVALTGWLRLSVLLNKQGLHVTVPARDESS